MTDRLSPQRRSALMARVRDRDTSPERIVRRLLHGVGYRYRLHRKDLPGKPDLVFSGRKKIVFIHGCWWHRHPGCQKASSPKSHVAYWEEKFRRNVERDALAATALAAAGWGILVVWECEVKHLEILRSKLIEFLGNVRTPSTKGPQLSEITCGRTCRHA